MSNGQTLQTTPAGEDIAAPHLAAIARMHAEAMAHIAGLAESWQQQLPQQQPPQFPAPTAAPQLPPPAARYGAPAHPATAEITTVPPQQAMPRPREAA
jgi:hypothetical protein